MSVLPVLGAKLYFLLIKIKMNNTPAKLRLQFCCEISTGGLKSPFKKQI